MMYFDRRTKERLERLVEATQPRASQAEVIRTLIDERFEKLFESDISVSCNENRVNGKVFRD